MQKPTYLKLFTSAFYLSAFTFGGGYVIVPLMKKRFVDELGWLQEDDMLNMAAIAQSAPGAMAVNASILVGWNLMGVGGAVVTILGTVLPPFLIISLVSLFYASVRDNPVVDAVLKGMMAGVAAVIFDTVFGMGAQVVKRKKIVPLLIMVGAYISNAVFKINLAYIILFCAILGGVLTLQGKKQGKEWL